jgi:hypothetical protein
MKRILWALLLTAVLISTPTVAQPVSTQRSPQQTSQGNPDVKVWVNTRSGVYHCPGMQLYGKTKQGEYMTQKQAQEKGYRPARSKVCK